MCYLSSTSLVDERVQAHDAREVNHVLRGRVPQGHLNFVPEVNVQLNLVLLLHINLKHTKISTH